MDTRNELLREALVAEVSYIKDEYVYPDLGRAFQHWAAVNVLGIEDTDVADELAGAMGSDGGVDYFHVNKDNKTVEIMQAKFTEKQVTRADQKAILEFFEIPKKLLVGNAEPTLRFHEQQKLFKKCREQKYATRLLFVTAANVPDSIKKIIGLNDQNMDNDITFECFEIDDLIAYVGNPSSPPCELHVFKNECFISGMNNAPIKRLVATVAASELKNVYKSIRRSTLFSLNPRFYLGDKKLISKGIVDTIEKEPERLWHYNNGISAVCRQFDYNRETGMLKIDNLKVVNGCQTVTTIGTMKSDINPSAGVVLRLSETSDVAFSEKISAYTNDQNSIKMPDLQSNHPYLVNLEKRFAKYDKFFFERKKGQLESSDKRIQSKRNLYVIKSVNASRLKMAYSLGMPNLSMQLSVSKLFKDESIDSNGLCPFSKLYNGADPRDFIIPHVFFYLLNIIKKRTGDSTEDDKNIKFLLRYRIGHYYIIGIIGKIFRSMNTATKNNLMDAIVESAIKYDDAIINKIVLELTKLVDWIAHQIPEVVGNEDQTPLHTKPVYYLRDPLRKDNRLQDLYIRRESWCKFDGRRDPFETKLCKIFNIPQVYR